jgi:hypothetical protein
MSHFKPIVSLLLGPLKDTHSMIVTKGTGDWRANPKQLEIFNEHFNGEVQILMSPEETEFEARSVIAAVMLGVTGSLPMRMWNWFMSFVTNPTTEFIVTAIGSGRGSSQYSTWRVTVSYLTGKVESAEMIHKSKSSGFPKSGEPNFDDMRASLSEHVGLKPDFVLMWGAAYYVANSSKFSDKGDFGPEMMNTLPTGQAFQKELPFLDLFNQTPVLALRNLKTASGDFKPGWGSGLEIPDGFFPEVYGDLGSGKYNLVEISNGKVLATCDVSVDDPVGSAQRVNQIQIQTN